MTSADQGRQGPATIPGRRICFATDEIHPSTTGGCGVLLHHAAELLRQAGHVVVFLLDVPAENFARFRDVDRHALAGGPPPPAYLVDELCQDLPWRRDAVQGPFQWTALRFEHALREIVRRESIELVEFIEYRGVGYHALARKLYGLDYQDCVLSVRVHNSMELIDAHEATRALTLERSLLHAQERAALELAESVLAPTETYARVFCEGVYGIPPAKTVISQSPRRPFPVVDRSDPSARREVVCFGRVFQFKGVDKLVQAARVLFERRPDLDVDFVFLGEDSRDTPVGRSHTEYLRRQIPAAWQERFQFPGQLTHEEAAARLSRALFGVFPNEFESFCYALHELYEAGVPVIANDLPGFADFFHHERNALLYDGTVKSLVAAMERLLDEPALREDLGRPYEVATAPLGDFYANPVARAPLAPRPDTASLAPASGLVLVLVRTGASDLDGTLATLNQQEPAGPADVVVLRESRGEKDGCVPFLGSLWQTWDRHGAPRSLASIRTLEALWILEAGDRPDPAFLRLAGGALARRPHLAFAGAWCHRRGRVRPAVLDVAPELWPYQEGAARTRVLLRTPPDRPLVDLFDARLGALGEIGYLWSAVDWYGPGCLLAEPLLEVAASSSSPADPKLLSFLVMSQRNPDRIRRLARLSAVLEQDATARSASRQSVQRLALANLDARSLWKLALQRLVSR